MKLSISNIGWAAEQDNAVYEMMKEYGFDGLEIAPTRIFPHKPYDKLEEARNWVNKLKRDHGFSVPSIQSIWFGRQEMLFGTNEERETLVAYTKKAVDFATAIDCKNLVFGCPRNRIVSDDGDLELGKRFFEKVGDYAAQKGTVIGIEANPSIYNTNYINDTVTALELIEQVHSDGIRLNLDVGTMIQNEESVEVLRGKVNLINHVHISEPRLIPIKERVLHKRLIQMLADEGYHGFISIEMGKVEELAVIEDKMNYLKRLIQ